MMLKKDAGVGKALLDWWEGLEDDRASRAVLRRAGSLTAVTLTPPYQGLYRRLRGADPAGGIRSFHDDRFAAVAGLLAHVERNDERAPAEAMSRRREGEDRPRVSPLRFQRLLEAPDLDALFVGIRRVLPLMDHSVDVLALADDVLHWGDAVKKRWAYAYEWPEKPKS